MENSIKAIVKKILPKQTFSSGFEKQNLIVEEDSEYSTPIEIQFLKDKISLLDGVQKGDEVEVHFNIRGSEYNGNYYVNLLGWRIEKSGGPKKVEAEEDSQGSSEEQDSWSNDDIPF